MAHVGGNWGRVRSVWSVLQRWSFVLFTFDAAHFQAWGETGRGYNKVSNTKHLSHTRWHVLRSRFIGARAGNQTHLITLFLETHVAVSNGFTCTRSKKLPECHRLGAERSSTLMGREKTRRTFPLMLFDSFWLMPGRAHCYSGATCSETSADAQISLQRLQRSCLACPKDMCEYQNDKSAALLEIAPRLNTILLKAL